jgi:chromosome partitioning protein
MQIVSFINMKGGVGKTTLTVNVAYGLARTHKKKVLLVDGDPQFNATQYLVDDDVYLKHVQDPNKGTLKDIFVPKKAGPINTTSGTAKASNKKKLALSQFIITVFNWKDWGRLDIIPSSLSLMEIETSQRQTETRLRTFLREKAVDYDYVIIDCPPTISIFTQAAVLASDKYVVPLKPDPLSVIGLPLLERWLSDFTEDVGIDIEAIGLVFTLVRGPLPTRMREVMDEIRDDRGESVFDSFLSQSTYVAQSVEVHEPLILYAKSKNGKVGREMKAITKEFLDRTGG